MKGATKGKGGKNSKKETKPRKEFVQMSTKAGLNFPVPRIAKMLKTHKYAHRIGVGAAVYITAVLEYIIHEILEISIEVLKLKKRSRINPSHISDAIKQDQDLADFFQGILITAVPSKKKKRMDEMETQAV